MSFLENSEGTSFDLKEIGLKSFEELLIASYKINFMEVAKQISKHPFPEIRLDKKIFTSNDIKYEKFGKDSTSDIY